MAFSRLTEETKGRIVDFLSSDASSLASAALTCRALLDRAQKHLFSNIILTREKKKRSYTSPGQTAQQLRATLEKHPHLATYVRRLELVGLYDQWNAEPVPKLFSQSKPSAHALECTKQQDAALAFCLPLFTHLRALIVALDDRDTCFEFSPNVLSSFITLLKQPTPSRLTYLDLTGAPAVVLWHCSGIKHLSLKLDDFFITASEWEALQGTLACTSGGLPPAFLDSLRVCLRHDQDAGIVDPESRPGGVYSWLFHPANHIKLSKLRKLVVETNDGMDEHQYTSRILGECASTLQEFAFNPSEEAFDPDGVNEPISLANLTALQKFSARTSTWSLGWYTRLLETVPTTSSSPIQELMVHIILDSPDDMNKTSRTRAAEWDALSDAVLAPGRFPHLRKFHVRWALADRQPDRLMTGERYRVEALSRLGDAGVLEVDFLRGRGAWDRELSVFPEDPAWDASLPRIARSVDYVNSLSA